MADRVPSPDGAIGGSKPGMPRWVKVFVIIAVLLIVVVVIGLVTGQLGPGGRHGPGRHLGGSRANTPSAGGQSPGGVGGPADASDAARTVEVAMLDSMAFQPAMITVATGDTVIFSVTNSGRSVHEFTLGNAAMQQEHAQAMAHMPAGMAHGFTNSVTVQPGKTAKLTWRFGDVSLEYACHVQGHYEAGMRGKINVT